MIPIFGLFGITLVEIALAAIVLAQSPHRPVNRWFAAFSGLLAVWGTINGIFRLLADPAVTLIVARTAFAAAALIPLAFFHFAFVFPHPAPSRRRLVQMVTLTGLFTCGLAFSPWIVAHVRLQPSAFQPVYGPLHPFFGFYFLTSFLWALIHLAGKLGQAKGVARVQLQYLFLGTALACLGAVTTNLVVPLLFGTSRFNLYGPYFTLIWVGFTAHAIVRYRLMDIRLVISRSVAYGAGWALISGVLVSGGVLFGTVVRAEISPVVSVLLGLVSGLVFVLLAPRMKRLADRYLYRPAYDARQLVRDGSRVMGTFADPERVTGAMADLISTALRLENLAIVVWAGESETFQPAVTRQVDPTLRWPVQALTPSSPLVRELMRHPRALLAEELLQRTPTREVAALAADMRAWRAEAAVPVQREGELIAILVVGAKLSGDPFFRDDLDLLETLASQLAIGLKNAQLYQEIVSIKEYNERILAHMDSGVVAVRDDGVVTTFNSAAERITGLSAALVLGRSVGSLDPAFQGILRESLTGQPDAESEITVRHPDGRTLPLLTHASALHDRTGHIRGAIAVFNDHSRLKALEEDKRRADRLAAVGALATGIAHEIRNPLVAIKTFAELLPERGDDQEFKSAFAKVAAKEVRRIEALLGRLRALAVPAAGRLHPLDLQVPIAETLDLIRGEADRRRVQVVTDIEPDLPAVLGEPDQLKQLFLNLFLNALEAMGTGGTLSVTVRADRQQSAARTPAKPRRTVAGFVTVRVTDTGPGIPTENLSRVFEPFFTTKPQGTGLGLAICRGIADAHRAALGAETGPAGVGTAFVIQFPALIGAPVAEALR
ncbi:MAG: PAS domain-containing protein [Candidatus Rokubacteria bacterium]|nr:PAS domain-containing protein [Candidatus Rokubacteria bacterium]